MMTFQVQSALLEHPAFLALSFLPQTLYYQVFVLSPDVGNIYVHP